MVEQVAKIMDNLQICAPRAAQAAVAMAMPGAWRLARRQPCRNRRPRRCAAGCHEPAAAAGRLQALGAYFAYIRHPFEGVRSEEVAEKLAREAGIVCLPGVYFGEGQERYLRFAFANADAATIGLLSDRLSRLTSL